MLLEFVAHDGPVLTAAFHQRRMELATSTTTCCIKVWSLAYNSEKKLKVSLARAYTDHDRPVSVVHMPLDGGLLFGSGGTDIWIWDLNRGQLLQCIRALQTFQVDMITAMQFVPSLNELTVGYSDGIIAVWSCPLQTTTMTTTTTTMQQGGAGSAGGDELKPRMVREFPSHGGRVNALVLTEDHRALFSCGADGIVRHSDALRAVQVGCTTLRMTKRAVFSKKLLEYPPSSMIVADVQAPFGSKRLLFVTAGSIVAIIEVGSPQWNFSAIKSPIIDIACSTSKVAILESSGDVKLVSPGTGRSQGQFTLMRRQIQALQPDRAIGQHRRRGSERKPLSLSNPTSILCWSEADAAVVGWSDGAVEVLDCSFVHREKRQGNKRNRIALFKSSANHSPVSSIAMLHFQTRKRRALPSGNSHRQQQPSVAATLDAVQHEALNRVGERGIAPQALPARQSRSLQGHGVALCASGEQRRSRGRPRRRGEPSCYRVAPLSADRRMALCGCGTLIPKRTAHCTMWQRTRGAVVSICVQYAGTHENDDGKAGRAHIVRVAPAPEALRVITVGQDGCVKVWQVSKSGRLMQLGFFYAQPEQHPLRAPICSRSCGAAVPRKSLLYATPLS